MKKVIILALTVLCVFGVMVACNSSGDVDVSADADVSADVGVNADVDVNAVKEKLNNSTWVSSGKDYATEKDFTATWTFTEDIVTVKNTLGTEEFEAEKAAYTVNSNGSISLSWDKVDNNRLTEIYFTFENEELKLFNDKEMEAPLTRK